MTHERSKRRPRHKRALFIVVLILLALAGIAFGLVLLDRRAAAPTAPAAPAKTADPAKPAAQPPAFDKTQYSTTDPSSLWVIVNKQHPLNPITYVPTDLVTLYGHQVSSRMSADLQAMMIDSAKAGAAITIASSYRSYTYQVGLYNGYVSSDGQADADTYSARPGYSEHQTGLAIDFSDRAGKCVVQDCYATTTEGKWLAANAYKYGFILRYTTADQAITGYESEPWHYRYVGQALSREMQRENVSTLEQFFGVTGGPSYAANPADSAGTGGSSQE